MTGTARHQGPIPSLTAPVPGLAICARPYPPRAPRYSAPVPLDPTPTLNADRVLALAAQGMFDSFARTAMGTMVVNREHRIVCFLSALGSAKSET